MPKKVRLNMKKIDVVAIDGPVGVGKSGVSRLLAEKLGYKAMDTGAMYRAITLAALRQGSMKKEEIEKMIKTIDVKLNETKHGLKVMLDGEDVSQAIREPEVSKATSHISDIIAVRKKLSELQREIGKAGRYVCEGRDQGTVVFADAKWKIYLDADVKTRVSRRVAQLEKAGKSVKQDEQEAQLKERDYRDRVREFGALKIAEDSIIFDTTDFSLDDVVNILFTIISRGNKNKD